MRKIAHGTTALGLAAVLAAALAAAACSLFRIRSQDEGPIIVQNGSMTIDTDPSAEWQADGGGWKNATGKDRNHKGTFWVRVDLRDGTTCKDSGHPVHVEYSAGGFKAIFTPAGNPPYTKVEPRGQDQLDLQTNQRLGHGSSADGGYITGVRINGSYIKVTGTNDVCPITKDNLTSVSICSSATVAKCQ